MGWRRAVGRCRAVGWRRAVKPLVIMGMNAIAVYMASELVDAALSELHWRGRIYSALFGWIESPYNASLAFAVSYMLAMWLIAWVMWRRGWIVRV